MAYHVTKQGDVLDAVCYQHYGHEAGTTETVLAQNAFLADYPEHLPAGLVIELPDLVLPVDAVQPVQLWD